MLTLGFVLALLGLALKLLRRVTNGGSALGRLRMEVVQRVALNPKQGIAVVRIAERMVVVSVGDGGVHRLFELDEHEVAAAQVVPATVPTSMALPPARGAIDFAAMLNVARSRVLPLLLLATLVLPTVAHAQQPSTEAGRRLVQGTARTATVATPTAAAAAQATAPKSLIEAPVSKLAPQMDLRIGGGEGLRLSGTVGVVVMMGLLTLLPSLLLMMTGFTRILIVLHFVRQALGTQSAPPGQLVAGLALLLTGFVMAPTLTEVNRTALQPWMNGTITQAEMLDVGVKPFRAFMLKQTRRQDVETFVRLSGQRGPITAETVPTVTLTSAFVISELRTAFQMGFAIFLPFIVIDIAVSAVLMSMGMMMLPPAMIALPFKLLLFVLADGWSLVVQSLVTSFR